MKKISMIVMALIINAAFVTMVMAQDKPAAKEPKNAAAATEIGKRITITGCLHKGTSWNAFVLLGVTERLADADASAPVLPVPIVMYWLDSTEGLKPLVGQMVEVTGKVISREPKPGTITVSIDPSLTLSTDVKLDSGSGNVTTKKYDDRPRPIGTSDSPSSVQVSRPVYKLAVDDVRPVHTGATGPACQ